MILEDEERDRETIKRLKKKKASFSQILNKKRLDDFELDQVLQEDL